MIRIQIGPKSWIRIQIQCIWIHNTAWYCRRRQEPEPVKIGSNSSRMLFLSFKSLIAVQEGSAPRWQTVLSESKIRIPYYYSILTDLSIRLKLKRSGATFFLLIFLQTISACLPNRGRHPTLQGCVVCSSKCCGAGWSRFLLTGSVQLFWCAI